MVAAYEGHPKSNQHPDHAFLTFLFVQLVSIVIL